MAMRSAQLAANIPNSGNRRSSLTNADAQRQPQQRPDSPIPDEPRSHSSTAVQSSQNSRPTAEDVERIAQLIRNARPLQQSNNRGSNVIGHEPRHQSRAVARPPQRQSQVGYSRRNDQLMSFGTQNAVSSYCNGHCFTAMRNASHYQQSDLYALQPLLNYYPEPRYVYQSSVQGVSTLKPTKVLHVHPNGRFSEHYPLREACQVQQVCIPETIHPRHGSVLYLSF
uniref:Uncharacterized protein n=1 Tax=Parascaris univalens TaxID=6257 RepID=A0A914ZTT5_PARUN